MTIKMTTMSGTAITRAKYCSQVRLDGGDLTENDERGGRREKGRAEENGGRGESGGVSGRAGRIGERGGGQDMEKTEEIEKDVEAHPKAQGTSGEATIPH